MAVTWRDQWASRIVSRGGKVIVTDSWLWRNPLTPPEYKMFAHARKALHKSIALCEPKQLRSNGFCHLRDFSRCVAFWAQGIGAARGFT